MKKYKSIVNRFNKKIDMYICEAGEGRYLMAIPEKMKDDAEMVVETYNSGGVQRQNYQESINDAMAPNGNAIEKTLMDAITDFPVVLPIVPNIKNLPDFQQLSLEAVRDFKIHEKVFECIQDAKTKIKMVTGKSVQDKIFLNGYSASGVFAQRFALIYPELINRCLIGGAAGTIPVPTIRIKYPIGLEDYDKLFGKKFNVEEYKKIKFGYYVGEREEQDDGNWNLEGERYEKGKGQVRAPMHDMSFMSITTPKEVGALQRQLLGQTMNERYKKAIEANKAIRS